MSILVTVIMDGGYMTFIQALKKLKEGYTIKRQRWLGDVKVVLRCGEVLFFTNGRIDLRPWTIENLEARDWVIYQEKE
jgi:hypothetical protein